jgi:predicted permease
MGEIFWSTIQSVSGAMLRIFVIMLIAGFLVRRKIITQEQIAALSKFTVIILLPSLIFSNNLLHFFPENDKTWWVLPLLGVGMILGGLAIASVFYLPDWKKNKNMLPLSSMQNAAYLVLPIVQILYPEKFPQYALYVFLFILGVTPLMWSLGKVLITASSENDYPFKIKNLLTPPLIANLLSILIVLSSLRNFVPKVFIDSTELLGKGAVPVATFILGATLGSISFRKKPPLIDIFRVNIVKFIFIPAASIFLLYHFQIYQSNPVLANLIVIQSAAAPATSLILQVKAYGGNTQKVGSMMLIAYIICLFAMPLWMAYWNKLIM